MVMYDDLIELMRYCANDNPVCEKSESCQFYNQAEEDYGYYFCVERMLKQAADAIEDLWQALDAAQGVLAEQPPTWIPVTERLPEESGDYLAFVTQVRDDNGLPLVSWIAIKHFYDVFLDKSVTHWMPLPEPPKGGET